MLEISCDMYKPQNVFDKLDHSDMLVEKPPVTAETNEINVTSDGSIKELCWQVANANCTNDIINTVQNEEVEVCSTRLSSKRIRTPKVLSDDFYGKE